MKLFSKLRSLLPSEPVKRTIRFDDAGFDVVGEEGVTVQVSWATVLEIVAFKRDLFSIDEICLGFRCQGRSDYQWAGEQDLGFAAFEKEVERRFTGMRPDWFGDVAIPAFQENWTTIWGTPLFKEGEPNKSATDNDGAAPRHV